MDQTWHHQVDNHHESGNNRADESCRERQMRTHSWTKRRRLQEVSWSLHVLVCAIVFAADVVNGNQQESSSDCVAERSAIDENRCRWSHRGRAAAAPAARQAAEHCVVLQQSARCPGQRAVQ
jgi:hypothetical protein